MTVIASIDELARRLAGPLPGRAVHAELAPSHTRRERLEPPPAGARESAVIAVLFEGDAGLRLPLIVRSTRVRTHRGQISLPGGGVDAGESAEQAARRELWEELGLPTGELRMLGALTPVYIPVTNYLVRPFVGFAAQRPVYRPNPDEVDEVIECALADFIGLDRVRRETRLLSAGPSEVPYYPAGDHKIWGATAMILGELGAIADCRLQIAD